MTKPTHLLLRLLLIFWISVVPCAAQRFANVFLNGAQMVCSIAQDSTGMMWIGTESGLYSYDGYHHFPHYRRHHVSNTHVYALQIKGGIIYMATGNGLLRYDIHNNAYLPDDTGEKKVRDMRALNPASPTTACSADVYSLLPVRQGLLLGTTHGLYLQTGKGRERLTLREGEQPLVNALTEDKDGKRLRGYWVGTEGALYHTDTSFSRFTKVDALDGNSVKCLATSQDGTLYIGTDNGFYTLSKSGSLQHAIHDSRNAFSIPNNIVWSCFVDKWQNVWIGTDHGLSYLSVRSYENIVPLSEITQSGEGNFLHELLQTSDGTWWMGGTNGLVHFSHTPAGFENVAWYKQNSTAYSLAHNRVRKVYEDRDGDLWIATDHGINLYDRQSRQMRNFVIYETSGKYSTAWAYDIVEDRQGRMWVAAYNGGIFITDKQRLKASQGHCTADRHISPERGGLSGLHVGQLVMADDNHVYASTYDGLDCIDIRTLQVTNRMKGEAVNYLLADHSGKVWTGGDGSVKRYDGDGKVSQWKVGGSVTTMCEVNGQIWAISGNICNVIDTQTAGASFLIPFISPQTLFYSERLQKVVMGGNDGLVTVSPAAFKQKVAPARLLLSGIMVNGTLRNDSVTAPQWITELVLKHDENNFTLQLSDLPFSGNPSFVYAYRLEGIDDDWQMLSDNSMSIAYNGLPPGHYRLTVHRMDADGGVGEEVYALDVTISPPWYLTIWAKMLYAVVAVMLLVWAMNFYLMRKRLSEERKQKAEILQQAKARMRFFDRLSHELKSPLSTLMNTLFAGQDPIDPKRSKERRTMCRATTQMNDLVIRTLDMGGIAVDENIPFEAVTVDVVALCRSVLADYPFCELKSEADHLMLPVDVVRWQTMITIVLRHIMQLTDETAKATLTIKVEKEPSAVALLFESEGLRETGQATDSYYEPPHTPTDNMALVKDYAEQHGGTLSTAEDGKALCLSFPIETAAAGDEPLAIGKSPMEEQADERFLAEVAQTIEKHMIDPDFNVTTLQETLGMGNKQLYRRLKALTGRTPVEYLRDIRMRKAALLLGEGKFSVSEVMYTVGFSGSSYFSKCFQKAFGMTPSEYIKRELPYKQKEEPD